MDARAGFAMERLASAIKEDVKREREIKTAALPQYDQHPQRIQ
jgi:hypothetical protein